LLLWQAVLQQRQKKLSGLDAEKKLQRLEQRQAELTRQVLALQQRLYDEDKKVFSFASETDQGNVDHLAAVVPRIEFLQRLNTPTRDLGIYKERWRRSRAAVAGTKKLLAAAGRYVVVARATGQYPYRFGVG